MFEEFSYKHYLFCKCCGVVLAPLEDEGYAIEGEIGYCSGCSRLFNERYGFKYIRLRTALQNV